jgi:parallel beta helix pectate lyase-like protein
MMAGLATPAEAAGFTETDLQAQLSSMGTINLPAGEVLISRGLRLPSRAILRGAGLHTVLRAASGLTAPVIRLVQPDTTAAEKEIQGCGIENLTIAGTGTSPIGIDYGADPAVSGSNPRSCWVRGVRVERFKTGIRVSWAEGGHFEDCKLIYNTTGIQVADGASGLQLTHCDFRHNGAALSARATSMPSNEWSVVRCHFESNSSTAVTLSGAQGWTFLRCKWEGNGVHVVFDSPNVNNVSLRPDSHQLIAASFNKTATGAAGISVNQGTRLMFQGCTASPALAQAIVFRAGWGSTLLGCSFKLSQVVGLNSGISVIPAGSLT